MIHIHDPPIKTVTPEERLRKAIKRWNITGSPYGLSLYRDRLKKRCEVVDALTLIGIKCCLIGALIFTLFKLIEILATPNEEEKMIFCLLLCNYQSNKSQ